MSVLYFIKYISISQNKCENVDPNHMILCHITLRHCFDTHSTSDTREEGGERAALIEYCAAPHWLCWNKRSSLVWWYYTNWVETPAQPLKMLNITETSVETPHWWVQHNTKHDHVKGRTHAFKVTRIKTIIIFYF